LLFVGTLWFYPVARSIMLGQFTLHVTLFLVMALWGLRRGRDGWAGLWLAATSVKPQMSILIVLWMVVWAVGWRRWRLVAGLAAGGVVLSLAAMILYPRWPISLLEDVLRYSQVAGGRNPLAVLMGWLWPGGPEALRYGLAGLLILGMLAVCRRGWRDDGEPFLQATFWVIVISLLVPFQTGTTNQALLFIPLFVWMRRGLRRWSPWLMLVGSGVILIGPWAIFLSTIKGNWENPVMFLPLPLFSLLVLVGIEVCKGQASRREMARSGPGRAQ
jgi:hypothetical protein